MKWLLVTPWFDENLRVMFRRPEVFKGLCHALDSNLSSNQGLNPELAFSDIAERCSEFILGITQYKLEAKLLIDTVPRINMIAFHA